jgi:hypothetical protein
MAAAKGNNYNPKGRSPKPIDWDEFEKLCGLQCTQSEIASWFGIIEDTIRERVKDHYGEDYSVIYKRYSETGKASLRRTQFKLAQKNAAMGIWLGKQWLGQKETMVENQISEETNKRYLDVMQQLLSLQSARKMADSNISSEPKS